MKVTESQIRQTVRRVLKEAKTPEERLADELANIEKEFEQLHADLEAKRQRRIDQANRKWSPEQVTKRSDSAKAANTPEKLAARQAEKEKDAKFMAAQRAQWNKPKTCAECGKELSTPTELSRVQYDDGPRWYCDIHDKNRKKDYQAWRSKGDEKGFY